MKIRDVVTYSRGGVGCNIYINGENFWQRVPTPRVLPKTNIISIEKQPCRVLHNCHIFNFNIARN